MLIEKLVSKKSPGKQSLYAAILQKTKIESSEVMSGSNKKNVPNDHADYEEQINVSKCTA